MIEYRHPKMEPTRLRHTGYGFDDYQHITKSVPNGLHPAERTIAHFDAVVSFPGRLGNAARGQIFEYVIYDTLVAHGVGIDRVAHDMGGGRNAEADLLTDTGWALLMKTSLRERWKQCDRDAHIIEVMHPRVSTCILYLRESDLDRETRLHRTSRRLRGQLFSKAELMSVYEEDEFADLIVRMGGVV